MFKIIQSNDIRVLAAHLSDFYRAKCEDVLSPFLVIVPAKVLEDWLKKTIARTLGISTLITTQFWGQYQWQMMADVLAVDAADLRAQGVGGQLAVPDVAMLSQAVIRWRIFDYLASSEQDAPQTKDGAVQAVILPLSSRAMQALNDEQHPLHALMQRISSESKATAQGKRAPKKNAEMSIEIHRLWQLTDALARLYVSYLTLRPDWLEAWASGRALNVRAMMEKKARLQNLQTQQPAQQNTDNHSDEHIQAELPEWLVADYEGVELAMRYLWQTLFARVYQARSDLSARFWQVMADAFALDGVRHHLAPKLKEVLPKTLYLFTVQQLPKAQLDFLKRLSCYVDVLLLHFNPSQLFWADVVDPNWLKARQIDAPDSVQLKDHGHTLLARLGKASRDTFAMLVDLSGGDDSDDYQVVWQDDFRMANIPVRVDTPMHNAPSNPHHTEAFAPNQSGNEQTKRLSLLSQLKNDMLLLDETGVKNAVGQAVFAELKRQALIDSALVTKAQTSAWSLALNAAGMTADDSLAIHRCHSLEGQLKAARLSIGRWLNGSNADGSPRRLSDVAVLMPDVASHHALIRSLFGSYQGADGLSLPARITGVADETVSQLWQAITGFYTQLHEGRFDAMTVYAWLNLVPLYESFGLTQAQMARGCELLRMAGFVRGFDALHLKQTLDAADLDYRYSFGFALDRLLSSLLMGQGVNRLFYPFVWQTDNHALIIPEATQGVAGVSADDAPIISALCQIYQALDRHRHDYQRMEDVLMWLKRMEDELMARYFAPLLDSDAMRTIFGAKNALKSSILATRHYDDGQQGRADEGAGMQLPLKFVLDSLAKNLANQHISAEPTEVITFGRFGALRGIDFGLIVMLDMNLSSFPRGEMPNRLDLMKAELPRRGDRNPEDDDNGAFLDALLSAQDACWIFYTAYAEDGKKMLPAAPVSELIQFFAQLNFQDSAFGAAGLATDAIERVASWLIYEHPRLPFDARQFEYTEDGIDIQALDKLKKQPPAPIWQAVYESMRAGEQPKSAPIIPLPDVDDIAPLLDWLMADDGEMLANAPVIVPEYCLGDVHKERASSDVGAVYLSDLLPTKLDVVSLARMLRNPAKTFLRGRLAVYVAEDEQPANEPLDLDGLGRWQLMQALMSDAGASDDDDVSEGFVHARMSDVLPVGAMRINALASSQADIQALKAKLTELQSAWQLDSLMLNLTWVQTRLSGVAITGAVPITTSDGAPSIWAVLSASRPSAPRLLEAYLSHLFWQYHHRTPSNAAFGADGSSVWQFSGELLPWINQDNVPSGSAFGFAPMAWQTAGRRLLKWLKFLLLMQQQPVVMTPLNGFILALMDKDETGKVAADKFNHNTFSKWQPMDKRADYQSDEQASNPYWQVLLGQANPLTALANAQDFSVIYHELLHAIISLDKELA